MHASGLLSLLFVLPLPFFGQAWLSPKGEGTVSVLDQYNIERLHTFSDGRTKDRGHTYFDALIVNTDFSITDRLVAENQVEKLDAIRLTFTAPLINAARHVAFLVAGAGKAERLAQVLDGPQDPEQLPSQLVRPTHGTLTWLVDEAAAAHLARAPK